MTTDMQQTFSMVTGSLYKEPCREESSMIQSQENSEVECSAVECYAADNGSWRGD
jgi:hypothetical protein